MRKGLRGYSASFVRAVETGDLPNLVSKFARFCFDRNISVTEAAQKLGVGRATVYLWFKGTVSPNARHQEAIQKIMARHRRP